MNNLECFMKNMAEMGVKMTPSKARKSMKAGEDFIDFIEKQSYLDPEWFTYLAEIEYKDLQFLCREIVNTRGIEMTPNELNDLVELILEVYQQDRSF